MAIQVELSWLIVRNCWITFKLRW